MNVILYLTIFIIGAILGTLTTLIVKTTLKEKVTRKRPYIVNAILSGIIFILFYDIIFFGQTIFSFVSIIFLRQLNSPSSSCTVI